MAEASGGATPGNFYNQIMNYPTSQTKNEQLSTSQNIPPIDLKQKQEIRQTTFAQYIKLSVNKVVEVSDDSESKERKFFWEHLNELTEEELELLQKKINSIANALVGNYDEADDFEQLRHLATNTINHKLKISYKHTRALQEQVSKRLKEMGEIKTKKDVRHYAIFHYEENEYHPQAFAKQFFADIVSHYDRLIAEGEIIRSDDKDNGHRFVRDCLIEKLVTRIL